MTGRSRPVSVGGYYIVQREHTITSVFAAGDVSDTRYRQAVTAAALERRSLFPRFLVRGMLALWRKPL